MSSRVHSGANPSPMKDAPISPATCFTSSMCWPFSAAASCSVSSGAPDSSNCPPGSSVMLALPRNSAIGLLPSITGSQPKRVRPSSMARMPSGPS